MADEAKSARAQRATKTSAGARAEKPAYVPSAARVRAATAGAKATNDKKAAEKELDGRKTEGDRPMNTHEYDFKKIGTMLTVVFALVAAGSEAMWPEQDDYLGPGTGTRPGLDVSWTEAMGAGFIIGESPFPSWFQWAGNYEKCAATKKFLYEFLGICKKYDLRPYQPWWGVTPAKWIRLLVRYKGDEGKAAAMEFIEFDKKCREAARDSVKDRPLPEDCEFCQEIAEAAAAFTEEQLVVFRGAVAELLGGGVDEGEGLAAVVGVDDDEGLAGGDSVCVGKRADGTDIILFLDHIAFTPIFRGYFGAFANSLLVPLLDIMPYDEIPAFFERVRKMSLTVAGGFARAEAPAPAEDGSTASLLAALGRL